MINGKNNMGEYRDSKKVMGEIKFYDNPENLSSHEIRMKLFALRPHIGPNSTERSETLYSYSTDLISKKEWIEKYTSKY